MEVFQYCNIGICHPDKCSFKGRSIICLFCEKIIYEDINLFLALLNPYQSICVAQYFSESTGILDIHCKIPISVMPGILLRENIIVRYDILLQVIRLLGIMNSAFIEYQPIEIFNYQSTLNIKIVEGFVNRFLTLIKSQEKVETDEFQIIELLEYLINYIDNISKSANSSIVENFLKIYAPYVKIFLPSAQNTYEIKTSLTLELFKIVNEHAHEIRESYSKFSLQFELIYVLIYIYLFAEDIELTVNFILRLLSEICKNNFIVPYKDDCITYLNNRLTKIKNSTSLQHKILLLQKDGFRDHISIQTLIDLQQLQKIYEEGFENFFCSKINNVVTHKILQYAISQTFPYILFGEDEKYFAYVLSLPILKQNYDQKNKVFHKNTISQCKSIIDFVLKFIEKINVFQKDKVIEYFTLDVFKMFLGAEDKFKDLFEQFFKLFVLNNS